MAATHMCAVVSSFSDTA